MSILIIHLVNPVPFANLKFRRGFIRSLGSDGVTWEHPFYSLFINEINEMKSMKKLTTLLAQWATLWPHLRPIGPSMGLSVLLWNFVQKIGPNVTKYTKMSKIFQGVYFNLLYMRQQVNTFVLISRRAFKYFATLAMRSSEFSCSNFLFPLLLGSGTSCPRITMFFYQRK